MSSNNSVPRMSNSLEEALNELRAAAEKNETVAEAIKLLASTAAEAAGRQRRAMTARELLHLAADSGVGQLSSAPSLSRKERRVDATATTAWAPFAKLLSSRPKLPGTGGKLVMPAEYFIFGDAKAFMDGLPGLLEGGLRRSMAEEAQENEGGKWLAEFRYVVERAAEEDVADLPSTAKFKGKWSVSGDLIVRDRGHRGMTLANFCEHEMARKAELTSAEVAAMRLYSGPMHEPIAKALRTEQIGDWATTIALCYSGVLKLSLHSEPARVYRGVKEDKVRLPPSFLNHEEGKFAGGVERAFTSTTKSPAVALDYSGGDETVGSIFVIDFDMNSRGASIQWLSQYPHEEELLFPPCTGLACLDVSQHDGKKCIRVSAQVSTAKLDTREVQTPDHVPGTLAATAWLAKQLRTTNESLAAMERWDLSRNPYMRDLEALANVTLLLGRAHSNFAVRTVDLQQCELSIAGIQMMAEALKLNGALLAINLDGTPLQIHELKGTEQHVTSLDLSRKRLGAASAALIGCLVAANASVTVINVLRNNFDAESAKMLTEVAKQKGLSLCGIRRNQTIANFSKQGLKPVDAILLASDLSQADVTPSLTRVR